ncbi:unnamed protein product [Paramecium primaurelia]|uniref:Transmembrane protein n=1 Tax=Paramecium primaurelia TaxID=5886 RepID=A0A8S1PQA4_PARPR|nr:unnamed protein product [Paramecium primaurelia]
MKIVQLMIQQNTNIQIFQQLEQVMQLMKGVYWTLWIFNINNQNVYKYSPKIIIGILILDGFEIYENKELRENLLLDYLEGTMICRNDILFNLYRPFSLKLKITRIDLTIKLRDYLNSKKIRTLGLYKLNDFQNHGDLETIFQDFSYLVLIFIVNIIILEHYFKFAKESNQNCKKKFLLKSNQSLWVLISLFNQKAQITMQEFSFLQSCLNSFQFQKVVYQE